MGPDPTRKIKIRIRTYTQIRPDLILVRAWFFSVRSGSNFLELGVDMFVLEGSGSWGMDPIFSQFFRSRSDLVEWRIRIQFFFLDAQIRILLYRWERVSTPGDVSEVEDGSDLRGQVSTAHQATSLTEQLHVLIFIYAIKKWECKK